MILTRGQIQNPVAEFMSLSRDVLCTNGEIKAFEQTPSDVKRVHDGNAQGFAAIQRVGRT